MEHTIVNQLDEKRAKIYKRYYDDEDNRDITIKCQDVEYLEKVKEVAYRDLAYSWSLNGGSSDLDRNYDDLKYVFDLNVDKIGKEYISRICRDASDVLQEIKYRIYKGIENDENISGIDESIESELYKQESPINFHNDLVRKKVHELTKDDIRNEHKRRADYWMSRSYEYGVRINDAQVDASQEKKVMRNAMTYRKNQMYFGKLVEENAKEAEEQFREEKMKMKRRR